MTPLFFFYGVSENVLIIESIEMGLRQYIEDLIPNERAMCAALMRAFGADKRDPTKPAKAYDELSLAEHVQLIVAEGNWPKFEPFLGPKKFFLQLMEQAGQIRNQQMHFRGELDSIQHDALVHARDWLATRPKPPAAGDGEQQVVHITPEDVPPTRPGGKYAALEDWLVKQKSKSSLVQVSFTDIEELLGEPLPPSAVEHRSWWANDSIGHVQSRAWLKAGWRVEDVDFNTKQVSFRLTVTALMNVFLSDLLERLKQTRPGLTRTSKVGLQNWMSIGAGKTGFSFSWTFTNDNELHVELYIDTGDKEQNKTAFDRLREQQDEIQRAFGSELMWQRLDNKQACRIFASRTAKITDPPEQLEQAKKWAIETGLRFIDALQPRIRGFDIR